MQQGKTRYAKQNNWPIFCKAKQEIHPLVQISYPSVFSCFAEMVMSKMLNTATQLISAIVMVS